MQVFRLYFKLLKQVFPAILVYIAVFLLVTILLAVNYKNPGDTVFVESKTPAVWINNDEENGFLDTFKEYLGQNCVFVDIGEEDIRDALFFHKISAAIVIPEGFTGRFFQEGHADILTRSVPDSMDALSLSLSVNQFLNTAAVYRDYTDTLSMEEIARKVEEDLGRKSEVTIYSSTERENKLLLNYMNYLSYGLLAILIISVGMIMLILQQTDIRRRNLVSPVPSGRFQAQLIMANFVFMVVLLGIFVGIAYVLCPDLKFNGQLILFIGNAGVFALCALAVSYLVGISIRQKSSRDAVVNCISMAMCFLGGVFVPQAMLDGGVRKIAAFVPTYWYVKANNLIGRSSEYTLEIKQELFKCMWIELGFAAAVFIIALVIGKKRSKEVNQ